MYRFHTSDHHRHDDAEPRDLVTLLIEVIIFMIIILLWPSK